MKIFLQKNRFFVSSVMALTITGLYLFLGVHISKYVRYVGVENGLNYWLIFPFNILRLISYFAPFIFIVVVVKFIISLFNQEDQAAKKFLGKTTILLFVINLAVLFTFVLTMFANIDHRSSVKVGKYVYNLASRLENEYGFNYYIFKCHQWDLSFDFSCEKVASFHADPDTFSYDRTMQSTLMYDFPQNALYATWNDKVIYKYQLNANTQP